MDDSIASIACVLGVLAGCGDVQTFKLSAGDMGSGSMPNVATSIEGSEVHMQRHCSRCKAKSAEPLVAKISNGLEFSADQVRTLVAPCPGSPDPSIDVEVDHLHLIVDFSNAEEKARFPDAEFDGYIFNVVGDERGPLLAYAWIDEETNVDIDFTLESGQLELDFAGADYDSSSFVQINLVFVESEAATVPFGG